jgi:hypothetical protein
VEASHGTIAAVHVKHPEKGDIPVKKCKRTLKWHKAAPG